MAFLALASACSEEGQARLDEALENIETTAPAEGGGDAGGDPPPETAPPETAPPETAPPETAPPETAAPEAAAPAAEDDGLSTEDWILILALAMIAIVIFVAATSAASRRSSAKASAAAQLQGQLSEVVGGARWVHDSGSTEVLLATDPDHLQTAWNDVRRRMVNLESQIATLAAGSGDANLDRDLRYLGQCVADLRSAEEGYVSARLRSGGRHAELTRTTDQTVTDRRSQLAAAIEPVAAAMRR